MLEYIPLRGSCIAPITMVEDSGFAGNSSASITEPQPSVHFWSDANLTMGVPEILGENVFHKLGAQES